MAAPHTTTRLAALARAASALSKALLTDHRYEALLDAALAIVPAESAVILGVDQAALVPVVARGVPEAALPSHLTVAHPQVATAITSPDPVWFPAVDPRLGVLGDTHESTASIMAGLRVDGELNGVLVFGGVAGPPLHEHERAELSVLAAMVAAALRCANLVEALEQTARRSGLINAALAAEALKAQGELRGQSEATRALRGEIETVAPTNLTVLVTGETGTGKELVARTLHARSARANRPLVYVNCAALPESLAESELFGHVRGAFTGAMEARTGRFELAHEGTLFLDEIGELPLAVQAKLLRALQFGEVQRVGADRVSVFNVRIIVATNRDLAAEVDAGRFRRDLFHRLAAYPIHIAPLRERPEDISVLMHHAADRARAQLGVGEVRLTHDALLAATAYDWPGNVREVEHVVTRAALRASVRCADCVVVVDAARLDLPTPPGPSTALAQPAHSELVGLPLGEAVDRFKHSLIASRLAANDHNWSVTARELGMDRGNFHRLAKRLGFSS